MTRKEALDLLTAIAAAYPTQKRDAGFIAIAADDLVASGLPARTVALRIVEWRRTSQWWPNISDLVYPEPVAQTTNLLPSPKALPAPIGIAKFRQILKGTQ